MTKTDAFDGSTRPQTADVPSRGRIRQAALPPSRRKRTRSVASAGGSGVGRAQQRKGSVLLERSKNFFHQYDEIDGTLLEMGGGASSGALQQDPWLEASKFALWRFEGLERRDRTTLQAQGLGQALYEARMAQMEDALFMQTLEGKRLKRFVMDVQKRNNRPAMELTNQLQSHQKKVCAAVKFFNFRFFSAFSKEQAALILKQLTIEFVPAGEVLYSVGEPAERAFFVLSGQVEVMVPTIPLPFGPLLPGQSIGAGEAFMAGIIDEVSEEMKRKNARQGKKSSLIGKPLRGGLLHRASARVTPWGQRGAVVAVLRRETVDRVVRGTLDQESSRMIELLHGCPPFHSLSPSQLGVIASHFTRVSVAHKAEVPLIGGFLIVVQGQAEVVVEVPSSFRRNSIRTQGYSPGNLSSAYTSNLAPTLAREPSSVRLGNPQATSPRKIAFKKSKSVRQLHEFNEEADFASPIGNRNLKLPVLLLEPGSLWGHVHLLGGDPLDDFVSQKLICATKEGCAALVMRPDHFNQLLYSLPKEELYAHARALHERVRGHVKTILEHVRKEDFTRKVFGYMALIKTELNQSNKRHRDTRKGAEWNRKPAFEDPTWDRYVKPDPPPKTKDELGTKEPEVTEVFATEIQRKMTNMSLLGKLSRVAVKSPNSKKNALKCNEDGNFGDLSEDLWDFVHTNSLAQPLKLGFVPGPEVTRFPKESSEAYRLKRSDTGKTERSYAW